MKRKEKLRLKQEELKAFDREFVEKGYIYIAGIDEVGRGPLAGPVCCAAVVLPHDCEILGIDDSKKVTEKRRMELYPKIKKEAIAYGIAMVGPEIIDEINILEATKMAMKEALRKVEESLTNQGKRLDIVLVDAVELKDLNYFSKSVIKGDEKSYSIAAASILAKVDRDDYMRKMDEKYPGYDFAKNKGYGTKAHCDAIRAIGKCPIHRESFTKNF